MEKFLDMTVLICQGAVVTLEIFVITLILSLPIGGLAALGRLSKFKPLSLLMEFYVWIMRGTPLMLQLLFVYFAEIFRAGLQAIPRGQFEAAHVLGLPHWHTMKRIVFPQVLRIVLPPISNETINLVKDTSLIYILAMNDLLRVARTIVQREFDMTPFVIAGAFYLAMTAVLTWAFKKLEAYYGKYDA